MKRFSFPTRPAQVPASLLRLMRRRPFVPTCLALLTALLAIGLLFSTRMPGTSCSGRPVRLSTAEQALKDRISQHVYRLADGIGERNIWRRGSMQKAADYIGAVMQNTGCSFSRQTYVVHATETVNLICEFSGSTSPEEIVLAGAHYDTVLNSPGADDNASGVAGLLALAELLAKERPQRTIRLVAFANEEPPFYFTDDMGSRRYALLARQKGEKILAMLSLEMLGYYADRPGSQAYPFPLQFFYPDTADFIAFVGNMGSRDLIRKAVAIFRQTTPFPAEGLAAPAAVPGVSWSDHWSFWREGFPAIMVTDTSFYRYHHYHTPADTAEKLDYDRLTRVVSGLARVVLALAENRE